MSISAFQRMTKSVLTLLGQGAFLRGTVPCTVNVEKSVQVSIDDVIYERDVATIDNTVNPAVNDTLSHPFGEYVLDRKLQNNGYSTRFILRPRTGGTP